MLYVKDSIHFFVKINLEVIQWAWEITCPKFAPTE